MNTEDSHYLEFWTRLHKFAAEDPLPQEAAKELNRLSQAYQTLDLSPEQRELVDDYIAGYGGYWNALVLAAYELGCADGALGIDRHI